MTEKGTQLKTDPKALSRPIAFTRDLRLVGRDDLLIAGGKAVGLGLLLAANLPVPPGFVILTSAYRAFVAHNHLQERLKSLEVAMSVMDDEAAEQVPAEVKALFTSGSLPQPLEQAIARSFRALAKQCVVVRSSATAEDLPDASFAGQHDSFLNINSEPQLFEAIRHCWASLWNTRAVAYRKRMGVCGDDRAIAVIVQTMVHADRSGVLFTANPLDHRRDRMLLSASFGLGEAVVGGDVSPDSWVLDAAGNSIRHTVADKQTVSLPAAKGTVNRPMPGQQRIQSSLQQTEVEALAKLGVKIQELFQCPQDVEWAIEDGNIQLVQSRPITSLFPLPQPQPGTKDGLRLYLCFNVHAQQMMEPFTPAGIDFWRTITAGFVHAATGMEDTRPLWLKQAAGRLFADITGLLRKPSRWPKLANALAEKDPVTGRALEEFGAREGKRITGAKGGLKLHWRMAVLLLRLGWTGLFACIRPQRARVQMLQKTSRAIRELAIQSKELKTMRARVHFIRHEIGRKGALIWLLPVAVMNPGLMAESALRRKVKAWFDDPNLLAPVQRALPHNVTTTMGISLWRISRNLQSSNQEPTVDHPEIKEFLQQFGHRALWEIDPGIERWAENPSYILELLRRYISSPPEHDPQTQFQQQFKNAESSATELVQRVRSAKGWLSAKVFAWQIHCYRQLAGLREQPKFEGARIIAIFRRILLEAGAELKAEGALDSAEDIMFLELEDWADWEKDGSTDLKIKVAAARRDYQREMNRKAVPRLMTSVGEAIFSAGVTKASNEADVFSGIPVSPGEYEGRARVVVHPMAAKLEPGEIIVCRGTDPGWTPLFLQAGALVMETGGAVSHGSIVAREYGLPAVAGVADATRLFQDGTLLRINGQTGEVTILECS